MKNQTKTEAPHSNGTNEILRTHFSLLLLGRVGKNKTLQSWSIICICLSRQSVMLSGAMMNSHWLGWSTQFGRSLSVGRETVRASVNCWTGNYTDVTHILVCLGIWLVQPRTCTNHFNIRLEIHSLKSMRPRHGCHEYPAPVLCVITNLQMQYEHW